MRRGCVAMATICAVVMGRASAQVYEFEIDGASSGFNGLLETDVGADGSIIGDWDPEVNPRGTRTKPVEAGDFQLGENAPVDAALGFSFGGDLETHVSGRFALELVRARDAVILSGLTLELLHDAQPSASATASIEPAAFLTRSPTSVFDGDPVALCVESVPLERVRFEQADGEVEGQLDVIETHRYRYRVSVPGVIRVRVHSFGAALELPPQPLRLALTGEITLSGDGAWLLAADALEVSTGTEERAALPPLAFALPTTDPPDEIAGVVGDLHSVSIDSTLMGELTLIAAGTRVQCVADFNGDGIVDTLDVLEYLHAWIGGDSRADIDGDGDTDSSDVIAFLHDWSTGCSF